MPEMQKIPFFATADDGVRLALWRIGRPDGVPVVLSHGSFSSHKSCLGLAQHLAATGFTCWVFDWRGRGASDRPTSAITFDTVSLLDVPCVIDTVVSMSPRNGSLFWVGHSGGGLVAAMWMARFAQLAQERVAGIVMLASQATGAAQGLIPRLRLTVFDGYLRCCRTAVGSRLGIGPENEDALMMRQWCRWNLQSSFRGHDHFDYLRALSALTMPVLALAGGGDHTISPVRGCQKLIEAYGSRDSTFLVCGKSQGFSENYTHNRLIHSRRAQQEIWPVVANWLAQRANSVG